MKKIITIILVLISFYLKAQNDLTRSEIRDSIQAISATVSLSDLKNLLDYNFATSVVAKTDVINSDVAVANAFTADFDTIDTYEVDAGAANVAITISNMQDGQIGWIDVINKASATVTWANADEITPNVSFLVDSLTQPL